MKKWVGILVTGTALLFILVNISTKNSGQKEIDFTKQIKEPSYEYGILVDSFNVIKGIVRKDETLGQILYANHIDHPQIAEIVSKSKGIFDVRSIYGLGWNCFIGYASIFTNCSCSWL